MCGVWMCIPMYEGGVFTGGVCVSVDRVGSVCARVGGTCMCMCVCWWGEVVLV